VSVEAKQTVHVVASGQRLGSIAKRYNVTVEELCRANNIRMRDPIKPGQKLVIPTPGSKTNALEPESEKSAKRIEPEKSREAASTHENAGGTSKPAKAGPLRFHTVYDGQRLGTIAKRYHVTLEALCYANGISQSDAIKPGQKLVIPSTDDVDGHIARRLYPPSSNTESKRTSSSNDKDESTTSSKSKTKTKSWQSYVRTPKKRGYVTLVGYSASWKGYVTGKNGVLPLAHRKISDLLGADGDERVPRKLLELLARVSDTFGGRSIRVVSGFRDFSYVAESKHKIGHAIDFSIPGVPNSALRDYLRTFKDVGVGYYPNSSFVHFDVRGYNAYWVDYAGPGERPRKTQNAPRRVASKSKGESAGEGHADVTSGASEHVGTAADTNEQTVSAPIDDAPPPDLPEPGQPSAPKPTLEAPEAPGPE
jgi:LysM repeat protein